VQKAYLNRQLETHARFIESHLAKNSWFAGDSLSMADIQMSFRSLPAGARRYRQSAAYSGVEEKG
jgi:glutathione S-transferase